MDYAVVFPGQGSQKVSMGLEILQQREVVDPILEEATDLLKLDVKSAFQRSDLINDANLVQPLLLTAEIAWWKVLRQFQLPSPKLIAGHSLGEYSALVAAECLSFEQTLKLVVQRSFRMNHSTTPLERKMGMLVVIGLEQRSVTAICTEVNRLQGEYIAIANLNSEQQFVLSGYLSSCNLATELAKKNKAKLVKLLPIQVASHCLLMKEAALAFSKDLVQVSFNEPKIPVFSNVDGALHTSASEIKKLLVDQMFSPVNWSEIVKKLEVNLVLECGPGKVLVNLIKRSRPEIKSWSLSENLLEIQEQFHE